MSALGFGRRQEGGGGQKVGDGVYARKGTIIAARPEYNASMTENSQYTDDIALRLKLEIGQEWQKELYIAGNFRKEGTPHGGEIISGWGSAFRVARVFDVLGVEGELSQDGRFSREAVQGLIGKEIVYLQYVRGVDPETGKPRYADFRLIEAQKPEEENIDAAVERLKGLFDADLNGGYLKNYNPDAASGGVSQDTFEAPGDDNDEWS